MKTHSPIKLETYQLFGRNLRINFDEVEELREDMEEGPETSYVYHTACVDKLADRDTIVEAVMQAVYPTIGSELAAIRNGGAEADEHESYRVLAKQLADGWIETRQ